MAFLAGAPSSSFKAVLVGPGPILGFPWRPFGWSRFGVGRFGHSIRKKGFLGYQTWIFWGSHLVLARGFGWPISPFLSGWVKTLGVSVIGRPCVRVSWGVTKGLGHTGVPYLWAKGRFREKPKNPGFNLNPTGIF